MKRIIAILFFLSITITLQAQVFIFENLGQRISKNDSLKIDRVIRYQTAFYKQFGTIDTIHIKLRLFSSQQTYEAHLRSQGVPITVYMHSGGGYNSKTKELAVPKIKERNYLEVIYHEISHHVIEQVLQNPPIWLNEGLAEYFEHIRIGRNDITHNIRRIGFIKTMIELKEINLKNFITLDWQNFWRSSVTNDAYSYKLAHAIVYFLVENHLEYFQQIFSKVKDGTTSFDAIENIYQGGFEQFEKDFFEFYKNK